MDRIHRLTRNQPVTEFFTCPVCTVPIGMSLNDMCDFCWYDFEASDDERQLLKESDTFRELSVHQWYSKLHVTRMTQSFISTISIMHILHDCFRLPATKTTIDHCLQTATNIFPESIPWLRRLIRGTLPIVLQPASNERIFKFAAGIRRTPIWYKITRNELNSSSKWSWTPYNLAINNIADPWLSCPQLLVSVGSYAGQVPVAENIFIILFLHTFRPDPPIVDDDPSINSKPAIRNHIREDVLKSLSNFTIRNDLA